MALRGKRGAGKEKTSAGKEKKAAAKGAKAKKAKEEPEASKAEGEKADEEAEVKETVKAEKDAKVEETALVVAKDAPAEEKGKKRRTKAHRLEEAQARAEADEERGVGEDEHVDKGVLYLGHIPFGFGEPQMRKYFNQFGTVLRLRLSRSKRNAASKGYAFIEFEEREVAKIVAQTMDNYLMFGKKLVCHVMDGEKIHPRLFKGWNRIMINHTKTRAIQSRHRYNDRPQCEVDGERVSRTTCQQMQRRQKSNKKLQALLEQLEVDYDLSEFSLPETPKVKAASSPKVKAAEPPSSGKRKRVAEEAEAAANELVEQDQADKAAATASPASPAGSKRKDRAKSGDAKAKVVEEAAPPAKAKAVEEAAPPAKVAKTAKAAKAGKKK